tara:strand:+ start:4586 stop:5755 length:1170 start_codon:yes stop_codon:yes gene_type:complete
VSKVTKYQTGFIVALKRELSQYQYRGGEFVFSIGVLLLSMVTVAWIFTSGTLTNLPIAVIDNDGSSVSRTYIRMLEASPHLHIVDKLSSPAEARELLEQASIYAFVLIPKHFTRDMKTGRQATVVAWYSRQFLTISGTITNSLLEITETLAASAQITSLAKRGESVLAAGVNSMPVQLELRTLFNPFQNYQYFLIAGLLPAMLQVFVMVWTVFLVGREFQEQTGARWLAIGGNVYMAIAAKVLPVFVVASAISIGCVNWLYGVAGWPVSGSLGLLLVGWELLIGAHIVLGVLFAGFAPNLATALSFAVFFTAPAFAYAGITFPQYAMPLVAQFWTYMLPIRTLLRLQIEQTEIGTPISNSMPELLVLVVFIVVPLPFAIRRIRTRCTTL